MRPGELFAHRFEIISLAGRGGMGEVYRAKDRTTGEELALKVMRSDGGTENTRFLREARVLAQLNHPGIVRHIDHGAADGDALYLAMEWLDGEDLSARLKRERLSVAEVVTVAKAAASALSAAHQAGVVHRDLKPANLLLVNRRVDQVKLLDFGIARVEATQARTRTGAVLGTPAYMPPEQARGAPVDARSDLWSLGVLLFEALAGQLPFTGEHLMAILAKVLFEPPPLLRGLRPDVPVRLSNLVQALLEKRPDDRPASAAEVLEQLGRLDAQSGVFSAVRAAGLSEAEQQRLFVVLARAENQALDTFTEAAATLPHQVGPRLPEGWSQQWTDSVTHIETLLDGSVIAAVSARGSAVDGAARAARLALALRQQLGTVRLALVTGRGSLEHGHPVGDVIDRGTALLLSTDGLPGVHLDEATAALLEGRFEVQRTGKGHQLRAENVRPEPVRTLLGKATPCVGRERELATLRGLLAEAIEQSTSRAAVVLAPPGTGKSRLAHELVWRVAPELGAMAWVAHYNQRVQAGLLSQLFAAFTGVPVAESPERRAQALRAVLTPLLPAESAERVIQVLSHVIGAAPMTNEVPELLAARRDPALMQGLTRRAAIDALRAACTQKPVVVVLEDLHWADANAVAWVDSVLEALSESPVLIAAFARPEVKERFPALWAKRGCVEIVLPELPKKGAERLMKQALGDAATPELMAQLFAVSAGNAFYLEELVRAVAEGRTQTLPDSVMAMAQSRYEMLEPDARRFLRAASVFGGSFWPEAAIAVIGGEESGHARTLKSLLQQELLQPLSSSRFGGHDELIFRHALLREAAYHALTDDDRKRAHRSAALWLEAAGEKNAGSLASHWQSAGDLERTAAAYTLAAEQSLAGGIFPLAIQNVEAARRHNPDAEQRARLSVVEVEALKWSDVPKDFISAAVLALSSLEPRSAAWLKVLADYNVFGWRLHPDYESVLSRHLPTVEQMPLKPELIAAWVQCAARLATQMCIARRAPLAATLIKRLEEVAATHTLEPASEAWLEQMRAFFAGAEHHHDRALQHFDRSRDLFYSIGDLPNAWAEEIDGLLTRSELGLYEEVLGKEPLLQRIETAGVYRVAMVLRGLLWSIAVELGHPNQVMGPIEKLFEHGPGRYAQSGMNTFIYAIALEKLGQWEKALATVEPTAQLFMNTPYELQVRALLARLYLELGQLERAAQMVEQPYRNEGHVRGLLGSRVHYDRARAEVMKASGRTDEYLSTLREARESIEEESHALEDLRIRAAFLAVRERRRLLELCNAELGPRR